MVQMLVERGANTAAQDQVGASHMMALEEPMITKQVVHRHGLKLSEKYEASQLVYLLYTYLRETWRLKLSWLVLFA